MKRFWMLFAALSALLLLHGEALASHFRYGTIAWVVPDPQAQPSTVKFTVTYAIAAGSALSLQDITFYFGDSTSSGEVVGAVIGTGTDAGGQGYEVRELTLTHTYAAFGAYTAYFDDCCRITQLVNGGSGNDGYRVDARVVLQPGNTSGPVSASPAVIQLQIGGPRTYTWPAFDPDGDPVTCRFGTALEAGFADPVPVVPDPVGPGTGGQSPVVATVPDGCQLSWDLADAQVPQRYVVHVVFESAHDGQLSSAALDLIVEMVASPPPGCAGGGVFIANAGQPFSTAVIGTDNLPTPLAVSAINAPPGSSLLPGASGLSPFLNTFSWTPQLADAGTTIVTINFRNALDHTGTCFLTVHVPECAGYGALCSVGYGQCASLGTNVCGGPGQTVCNATPGSPADEACDGLDNDCDGEVDDGDPGGGGSCFTGLDGACAQGHTACIGGVLACLPEVEPGAQIEVCNGQDDDCDGQIDDGFGVGNACTSGAGACEQAGTIVCDAAGGAACSATPGTPSEEVCGDGVDQDCDGVPDDGCNGGSGGGGGAGTGGEAGGDTGGAGGTGGEAGGNTGGAGGTGTGGSTSSGGGDTGGAGGTSTGGNTSTGGGEAGGTGPHHAPDDAELERVTPQGNGVFCAALPPARGGGSPVGLGLLAGAALLALRARRRR